MRRRGLGGECEAIGAGRVGEATELDRPWVLDRAGFLRRQRLAQDLAVDEPPVGPAELRDRAADAADTSRRSRARETATSSDTIAPIE